VIINWFSTIGTGKGYSGSSERIALALNKVADVRLALFNPDKYKLFTKDALKLKEKPFQLGKIGICYSTPVGFSSIINEVKIGYTMWETDKVPVHDKMWGGGDAIKTINSLDRLFVPCKHNYNLFREYGVKIPIDIVHLGFDPKEYYPLERTKDRPFTFLMLGKLTMRKNTGAVVTAFLDLFKGNPNARLILKSQSGIMAHFEFPEDKNITIIDRLSTQEEMLGYYKESDCFVLPSRGEGFGLPVLEAMATGMPCIFSNHTGLAEMADEKYNYPINNYKKVKANPTMTKSRCDVGNWYDPSLEELKEKMAYVFKNQSEAKEKGKMAAEWVKNNFTFSHTAKSILNILEKNYDTTKLH